MHFFKRGGGVIKVCLYYNSSLKPIIQKAAELKSFQVVLIKSFKIFIPMGMDGPKGKGWSQRLKYESMQNFFERIFL